VQYTSFVPYHWASIKKIALQQRQRSEPAGSSSLPSLHRTFTEAPQRSSTSNFKSTKASFCLYPVSDILSISILASALPAVTAPVIASTFIAFCFVLIEMCQAFFDWHAFFETV
jgi:hypothetical protein